MEAFGCCSHYVKCSDLGKCLFISNEDYQGCKYRINLEAGRNFYSSKQLKEVANNFPENIYICCYDRDFKIGHLGGNGYTYPLSEDEKRVLLHKLKELNIPLSIENDTSRCIVEGDEHEPANSRVIFSLEKDGTKFTITNQNSYFIKKRYADGICKSLINKGITSKVDLLGSFAKITEYPKIKNSNISNVKDIIIENDAKIYKNELQEVKENIRIPIIETGTQISIFDLM